MTTKTKEEKTTEFEAFDHVWLWGSGKGKPKAMVPPSIAGTFSFETGLAYVSEAAVMRCWASRPDCHDYGHPLPKRVTLERAKRLALRQGLMGLVVLDGDHLAVARHGLAR